jgi:hypothetical protein
MEHAKIALRRLADAGAGQIGLVISKYDSDKDPGASVYAYSYDYSTVVDDTFAEPVRRKAPDRQVEVLAAEMVG